MSYSIMNDKPEKYPYVYLFHCYDECISPLNKYGYANNDTDATMTIKFLMFIVFCFLTIIGMVWLL